MNEMGGDEYGGYVVVVTGDPKEPNGINGGLFQAEKKELNAYRCVIAVDDVEKTMEDIKAAGGKVLSEKADEIPNVGKFANCEDPEGNRFAILQPSPDMVTQK